MPGVFRIRHERRTRRKLRVQLYPFAPVVDTGSGSASFSVTAAAGGASEAVASGAANLNFTAAAGGIGGGLLKTDLISHWPLGEASGNAIDGHGSNDLTETGGTIATTTGKVGNCRDVELSSSQYFTIADNADLSTGDIDFTIAGWFQFESKPGAVMTLVSKSLTAGNQLEWRLYWSNTTDRINFRVSSTGTNTPTIAADSLGAPSTATWYFVVAWHDATANTINIQVNDGTVDSVSHTLGVLNSTAAFVIGAMDGGGITPFDGLIDEVAFWKRTLTSGERTELYNGGAGLPYSDWDAVADTGSGSASLNFTAAAGGAADGIGSGAASFNLTAAAGGALEASGSGSASVNFTAATSGASESVGSGSASLNCTADGVGAADATGSGSASFSITADGVGILPGTGSGSSTFEFAASAGGSADGIGSGSATVNFTATAVGLADAVGSGAASFSFTAVGVDGDIPVASPVEGWVACGLNRVAVASGVSRVVWAKAQGK